MKKLGYKKMLRDRCPKMVNYALKWRKAKEKWIDHVYSNFIGIYRDKDQRNNATRIALGIAEQGKYQFEFDKTINWDDLTNEEKEYWERISKWVKWFMKEFQCIERAYSISKQKGKDDFDIQIEIIRDYLSWLLPSPNCTQEEKEAKYQYVDNLAEFLICCIEGKY